MLSETLKALAAPAPRATLSSATAKSTLPKAANCCATRTCCSGSATLMLKETGASGAVSVEAQPKLLDAPS